MATEHDFLGFEQKLREHRSAFQQLLDFAQAAGKKNAAVFSGACLKYLDQMDVLLSAQADMTDTTEPDYSIVERTAAMRRDLIALQKQLTAMSRAGYGIESN